MERIGRREENRQDAYRLFFFIVLAPLVFTLLYFVLGSVIPFVLAGILMAGAMLILWIRVFPRLLGDRGAQAGYYQEEAHPMLRYIFVLLVGAVFYGIFQIFLSPDIALGATIFALAVAYAILWYTAGKEEREALEKKKAKDKAYIKSLGTSENRCQSCMKPMDPDAQFCEHCGFKRRNLSKIS
jgi:hypothetical protein